MEVASCLRLERREPANPGSGQRLAGSVTSGLRIHDFSKEVVGPLNFKHQLRLFDGLETEGGAGRVICGLDFHAFDACFNQMSIPRTSLRSVAWRSFRIACELGRFRWPKQSRVCAAEAPSWTGVFGSGDGLATITCGEVSYR